MLNGMYLTLTDWRVLYMAAVQDGEIIYVSWGHIDDQGNVIQYGING